MLDFELDKVKLVSVVGKISLEAMSEESKDIPLQQFLSMWKDSLPESWRDDAKVELIEGSFELPTPSSIRFKDPSRINEKLSNAGLAGKSSTSGRNWHEKFKNRRSEV